MNECEWINREEGVRFVFGCDEVRPFHCRMSCRMGVGSLIQVDLAKPLESNFFSVCCSSSSSDPSSADVVTCSANILIVKCAVPLVVSPITKTFRTCSVFTREKTHKQFCSKNVR